MTYNPTKPTTAQNYPPLAGYENLTAAERDTFAALLAKATYGVELQRIDTLTTPEEWLTALARAVMPHMTEVERQGVRTLRGPKHGFPHGAGHTYNPQTIGTFQI